MNDGTCRAPGCTVIPKTPRRGMCESHYRRYMKYGDPSGGRPAFASDAERFWSKVDRRGPDECWPFLGYLDPDGYGVFTVNHVNVRAHRYAYELMVGPIPDGLPLDHVKANGCTRRDCMNAPAHLEPVTVFENTMRGDGPSAENARKTFCKRGHEFTPESTYTYSDGRRSCIPCQQDYQRRWYLGKRKPSRDRSSA